jgi:hypothetical protein
MTLLRVRLSDVGLEFLGRQETYAHFLVGSL